MKALPISGRSAPSDLVLLSVRDLMRLLGVRRTTIWKLRRQPDFPKPVMLTHNLSWRAVDVQRWLAQRLAQAGGPAAQQPFATPSSKEE